MANSPPQTERVGLLRKIGRALKAWLSMGKCCSSCDIPFMRPAEKPEQTKHE